MAFKAMKWDEIIKGRNVYREEKGVEKEDSLKGVLDSE